jgi:hypothetical protein
MHFCTDELQMILFIARDGMEHVLRYAKAATLYTCYCVRCTAQKFFNRS